MSSSPANESPPRDTGDEDINKLPSANVDTPNTNNSGGERDQDDNSRSRSRERGGGRKVRVSIVLSFDFMC